MLSITKAKAFINCFKLRFLTITYEIKIKHESNPNLEELIITKIYEQTN